MTRKVVTLQQVRDYIAEDNPVLANDLSLGICALVSVYDMGFCRDGVTRWYLFDLDDTPCIYFKR